MPPWLTSPVFTLALFEVFTPSESDLLAPVFAVLTFWLPDPPALFPAICWPAPPCAPFPFWFVLSCAPFPLWSAFPFWFPFGAVCLTCKAFIALTTAFLPHRCPLQQEPYQHCNQKGFPPCLQLPEYRLSCQEV